MARKSKRHVVHHRRVEHRVKHKTHRGEKREAGLSGLFKGGGFKLGY
jgi:hypothetical protein